MKQFVVDGRNLLERFLESIGQVVEKVREVLEGRIWSIGDGAPILVEYLEIL